MNSDPVHWRVERIHITSSMLPCGHVWNYNNLFILRRPAYEYSFLFYRLHCQIQKLEVLFGKFCTLSMAGLFLNSDKHSHSWKHPHTGYIISRALNVFEAITGLESAPFFSVRCLQNILPLGWNYVCTYLEFCSNTKNGENISL